MSDGQIQAANQQVAAAVGLQQDLVLGAPAVAIVTTGGESNAQANDYGRLLAAISGAEVGSSTDAVLNDLAQKLDDAAGPGLVLEVLLEGAAQVALPELVDQVSDITSQKSAQVSIDPVAVDNRLSADEMAAGVTVSGTAAPNASVTIEWSDVSSGGQSTGSRSVTADAQGRWTSSFAASEMPALGATSLKASVGSAVATRSIYLDEPAAPVVTLRTDSGSSANDGLTNDARVDVSGYVAGWDYSTDGGQHWNPGQGSSFQVSGDGAKTVLVRQNVGGHYSAPASLGFTLDTLEPSVLVSSDKSALKVGETATITFTLSEPSSDFTQDDVSVTVGSLSNFTGSGKNYSATFTPTADSNAAAKVSVIEKRFTDAAGNANESGDGDSTTMGIDTQRPTVAINSDKSALKVGETAAITFTLSEPNSDFAAEDVVVSGGSLSNFTGSGTSYSATFTPTADSTKAGSISVASDKFSDAAGNLNADGSEANNTAAISIDTVRPTVEVTSDKIALKFSETATIAFTFSEDPGSSFAWDGSAGDVLVTGGSLGAISGSGLTRSATFTPTADSNAPASISVASAQFADAAGNQNTDGSDANNAVAISVDTVRPTIAVSSDKTALKAGEAASLSFTLSEASSDFTADDVAVSGGTLSGFSGSGKDYSATFTPTADSNAPASISVASAKFSDAAGNQNAVGSDVNNAVAISVDTLRPTIAVASDKTALKAGETASLSFTLSESSSDFTADDVVVSGGSLSNFTGSGTSYSVTFTPTANSNTAGSISVASAKFADAAGNQNADGADANNNVSISVDTVRPTIAVASDKTALKAGETATITFTLSEASSDFTESDVTVSGGTLSNFQGSGKSYSATFTPTPNSNELANIDVGRENLFRDAAGNTNLGGDGADVSLYIGVDTLRPTVAISSDKIALKVGETAVITFTLSEASSDFSQADVTVSGGILSNFTGSGKNYSATFTPTADSNAAASISVASDKFSDVAGNLNADGSEANNTAAISIDTQAPVAPNAALETDSGGNSDGLTNSGALTAPTNAEAGAQVEYRVKGPDDADYGNWSSSYTAPATDGSDDGACSVEVRQTDKAGNVSDSQTISFTLDTSKPATPTAKLTTDSSHGGEGFGSDGLTNSGAITAPTNTETDAKVEYRVKQGDGQFSAWSSSYTAATTDAAYQVEVRQTDKAGNVSEVQSLSFTLDTSKPATPTAKLTTDSSNGGEGFGSDGLTYSGAITAPTNTETDAQVEYRVKGPDDADYGSWNSSYTAPATDGSDDGACSVEVRQTDKAGNVSDSQTISFTLDTLAPSVLVSSDKSALKVGETAAITFTLSEASSDFTADDVSVTVGSLSNFTGSGKHYSATFTPSANYNDADVQASIQVASTKFADAAGNTNADGSDTNNTASIAVDTQRPTVAISSDKTALKAGATAKITFTLSEDSSDFTADDVTVSGGTLSNFAGSGSSYSATFTPTAGSNAPASISVASAKFADAFGNQNADGSEANNTLAIIIDTQAPVAPNAALATDSGASDSDGLTNSGALTAPANAESGALVEYRVKGPGAADYGDWSSSYTAPATNGQADGSYTVEVRQTDAAGNVSDNQTIAFTLDATQPVASITMSDTKLKIGETAQITISFTEPVTGLDTMPSIAFEIEGGTLSGLSTSDNGLTWTGTFTPYEEYADSELRSTFPISSAEDGAGNYGKGQNLTPSYDIDTWAPEAPNAQLKTDSGARSSDGLTNSGALKAPSNDEQGSCLVEYRVKGPGAADFGNWSSSYTAPATNGKADGAYQVQVRQTDAAGNLSGLQTLAYQLDTTAPTAKLSLGDGPLVIGQETPITITFSEPVSGITVNQWQFTVEGGYLSDLTTSDGGLTWTGTFTPSSVNVTITFPELLLQDAAGNFVTGSVSTADTEAPTFQSIVLSDTALKKGDTATVSVTFSEAVTGFTSADVTAPHGKVGDFTSNDNGVTWTATYIPDDDLESAVNKVSVAANSYTDVAGNQGGAGSSDSFVIDTQLAQAVQGIALVSEAGPQGQWALTRSIPTFVSPFGFFFMSAELSLHNADGSTSPAQTLSALPFDLEYSFRMATPQNPITFGSDGGYAIVSGQLFGAPQCWEVQVYNAQGVAQGDPLAIPANTNLAPRVVAIGGGYAVAFAEANDVGPQLKLQFVGLDGSLAGSGSISDSIGVASFDLTPVSGGGRGGPGLVWCQQLAKSHGHSDD